MKTKKLSKANVAVMAGEFTYNVSVQTLYKAMTAGIARWWSPDYLIGAKNAKRIVVEPKIGGRMFEEWKGKGEGSLWGHVSELKKDERLEICGTLGASGAIFGKAGFDFVSKGKKKSQLTLRHAMTGEVDSEDLAEYSAGWDFLLDQLLRKHLEK